MNLSEKLYKLYLLLRFRNRDCAEIYPVIRHLLKNNHDQIYHIVDDNSYIMHAPLYDDGYLFDDGSHKIFAARRRTYEKIALPFEPGVAYKIGILYDFEVTAPHGKLFQNDKNCSVFTVTGARRNMPRKIFRYMRRHSPKQNIIHDVISNHIRY
ncbi:MAG: hypothetical protein NC311_01170 [Muribaculaceae bacterium]|nr:hypothetical protein [Muribaculaceae bacterium]